MTSDTDERRAIFEELRRLQAGYQTVSKPLDPRSPGELREGETEATPKR